MVGALLSLALALLVGCGGIIKEHRDSAEIRLRKRAAFDLECKESALVLTPLDDSPAPNVYGVEGCGRRATYVEGGSPNWLMNSDPRPSATPAAEASEASPTAAP